MTFFGPVLDPPLGWSVRKTTTLVRDLEYFLHTKYHQNPSSRSEEFENANLLTDDGRTTDNGQRLITIGHWSLRLLCPKTIVLMCCRVTENPEDRKCQAEKSSILHIRSDFLVGVWENLHHRMCSKRYSESSSYCLLNTESEIIVWYSRKWENEETVNMIKGTRAMEKTNTFISKLDKNSEWKNHLLCRTLFH